MNKAIFISGYLHGLSDNILPFLDKDTDIYVHTWQDRGNQRWIDKLKRYEKYCGNITIMSEKPKFKNKLLSYAYSTYASVKMATKIEDYDICIKFKPDLDTDTIEYNQDISFSFLKAKLQSRPLLEDYKKEDCVYGTVHYKTIDERMFTSFPKPLKKVFHKTFKYFLKEIEDINNKFNFMLGENYEGSIFWTELFETNGVPIIQDLNLKLPNNKQWQ